MKYNNKFNLEKLSYRSLYNLLCELYRKLYYVDEIRDNYNLYTGFTKEEAKKIEYYNRGTHIFHESLVDFHECDDEDDKGETIFSYDETIKYM